MKKIWVGLALVSILTTGCVAVKPYEKTYLNDSEMTLANRTVEKTEANYLLYREGSSGANGGKNGGGCGCN
ncbi:MAG: DUF4266 domain-containing protein [Tannerella sp.]|jgi:hypothetical protein|nr:DUF4266 domain-containing protein [Tannerella sp.]